MARFWTKPFGQSASFYDRIYGTPSKDYREEARIVQRVIQSFQKSSGTSLLDVACGTGRHLEYLQKTYSAVGVDASAAMLQLARRRCPGIRFSLGDMGEFRLARRFDAVVCLFASLGYTRTLQRLRRAVRNMSEHMLPGGVLVIEPWVRERDGRGLRAVYVDEPELRACRVNGPAVHGRRTSIVDYYYVVGTRDRVRCFAERHVLGAFRRGDYFAAMRAAGLEPIAIPERQREKRFPHGLYLGYKTAPVSIARRTIADRPGRH